MLRVPRTPSAITIDGETDEAAWVSGPARTGAFLAPSGAPAQPYSEARLLWGNGELYLTLYAADDDIESRATRNDGPLWMDDSFRVTLSRDGVDYVIEVAPSGIVADAIRRDGGALDYKWQSGARIARDMDGTLNDPKDNDEEWVIEMAIPLAALGMKGESGETVTFSLSRCDTPKLSRRVCSSWGDGTTCGRLVLE